ncbi:sucrase ferredoxin domain containing protein [Pyrenophora tritici-repentis]|nr:Sucrase/ferredoxin domain-containing protein [Pyrenophora tritici-repentis]KAF7577613.1 hypothetical protein PtrM4_018530 [Pyrenophora tritici-repentis]KAI0587093.1 Sucrase/ferredoxin domain-containing protein [Pyrenophora tritici-repentis]KAI0589357.1 Sucrase/ferredoxin domain-containing protein [Pyrenophora tritici-repentis]KAI0611348.1 Sucrase/ferredoxin domain-containing protein [Pyrenophora tritici-repentis]
MSTDACGNIYDPSYQGAEESTGGESAVRARSDQRRLKEMGSSVSRENRRAGVVIIADFLNKLFQRDDDDESGEKIERRNNRP